MKPHACTHRGFFKKRIRRKLVTEPNYLLKMLNQNEILSAPLKGV